MKAGRVVAAASLGWGLLMAAGSVRAGPVARQTAGQAAASQVDTRPAMSPSEAQREIEALDRAEAAERNDRKARMPLVAAGLSLPDESGVFALDHYEGVPELLHLAQADGDRNEHPYDGVRAVETKTLHGLRAVVSMPGGHAAVELHEAKPVFYARVRSGPVVVGGDAVVMRTPELPERPKPMDASGKPRFYLLPVEVLRGGRVLRALQLRDLGPDKLATGLLPGVPVALRGKVLPGRDWMRLEAAQAVPEGQYVLVEMLSPAVVNVDVWAVGVDKNAPENRHPRTPVEE
jgi:hypothetical protein